MAVAGIIVGQAIVVPQYAIALAGQQHRNANLRIYLRQSARQPTNIGISVLKLPEAIEVFALGGIKHQRGLPVLPFMAERPKDDTAGFVAHRHAISFNRSRQHRGLHLLVLHINPVGQ